MHFFQKKCLRVGKKVVLLHPQTTEVGLGNGDVCTVL